MKTRTKFVIGGVVIFAVIAALSVQELQEMTVFFYTPAEVLASPNEFENKTIRIGALVQKDSVEWDAQAIELSFKITSMLELNQICFVKDRVLLWRVK